MRPGSDLQWRLEAVLPFFNGQMTIGKFGKTVGDEYTYEAWCRFQLVETQPEDLYAVWHCGEKRCKTCEKCHVEKGL